MVTAEPRRVRPSRRALVLGGAGVLGLAAAGTTFGNWAVPSLFGDDEPSPSPSPTGEPETLDDDLIKGITLLDKGFSAQPPRPGGDVPLVGVGARLRNTTDKALWITASYLPVGADGDRLPDPDNSKGFAGFGYGEIPIPPASVIDSVGIGDISESRLDVDDIDRLAVQLHHLNFDAKFADAHVIPATVSDLDYHSGDDRGVDFVTVTADNPGPGIERADYLVHFADTEGATIGGWYADRSRWDGLEKRLPDDETEEYPAGSSSHTLPVWLPPKLKPAQVSLYLWAEP